MNQTEGESQIYVTLQVRLCDLVAPLSLNLRYITLIQNILMLFISQNNNKKKNDA